MPWYAGCSRPHVRGRRLSAGDVGGGGCPVSAPARGLSRAAVSAVVRGGTRRRCTADWGRAAPSPSAVRHADTGRHRLTCLDANGLVSDSTVTVLCDSAVSVLCESAVTVLCDSYV